MSSIDDTQAAIDALENPEPDEPEAAEVESGADDATAEPAAVEEAILGKFKTQDDLVKAYQELERQFTQERQQPAAEPEPVADPFNPLAHFAIGFDDDDRNQIAQSTYSAPQETLEWAMSEEIAKYQPQLQHEIFQLWQSFAPIDAQRYIARSSVEAERKEVESLRSEWQQEQAAKQQENYGRTASNAIALTTQNLPDFETYRPRIAQLMDDFMLPETHPLAQTPEGLAQFTEHLYWIAKGEEFKRQEVAATPAAATKAAGQKARTQTRSTAATGGELGMTEQQFLDEVLAGQPGRN